MPKKLIKKSKTVIVKQFKTVGTKRVVVKEYRFRRSTYEKYKKLYQQERNKTIKTYYKNLAKARITSSDPNRTYNEYAFKYKSFRQVLTQGVDVYQEKNKVATIKGYKAVQKRVKSFKRYRSNSSNLNNWKRNYFKALNNIGASASDIKKVRDEMNKLGDTKLRILISDGFIDIKFLYTQQTPINQLINQIINYLNLDKRLGTEKTADYYNVLEKQLKNKKYITQESIKIRQLDRALRGKKWKPL